MRGTGVLAENPLCGQQGLDQIGIEVERVGYQSMHTTGVQRQTP